MLSNGQTTLPNCHPGKIAKGCEIRALNQCLSVLSGSAEKKTTVERAFCLIKRKNARKRGMPHAESS